MNLNINTLVLYKMIYPIIQARVYRIISKKHPEFSYVGSTFGTLKQRFYQHKMGYKCWKNDKGGRCSLYEYFDKWGVQDFKMVEMGVYMVCAENSKDRTHLNFWEQLWINRTRGCCNKQDCFTIEYLQKIKQKERDAKYRLENKQKRKETQAKYYIEHKEEIKEYHVKYKKEHKEEIKEREAKYYTEHKDEIKEKNREKVTCECGAIVTKGNLKRHQKSPKHIRLMEM